MSRRLFSILGAIAAATALPLTPADSHAQAGAPTAPSRSASAREAAPLDLTGYWVTLVYEDWRFLMVTPPPGDFDSVPLTPEGRKVASLWKGPEADEAAGTQCKPYGAAAIMRMPGRIHVTWRDNNTLKIDKDHGEQTRLLHFGGRAKAGGTRTWQGTSAASWEEHRPPGPSTTRSGWLQVVTTGMRAGYLRKNGVPYSENAVVTEYFDARREPGGFEWLVVTTVVEDPLYLTQPFITSTNYRSEPDGSKWSPLPCKTLPPPTPRQP